MKDKNTERIERERKEKLKLELSQREEYLKKLFRIEAQEMKERLRKAKKEQYYLKKQAKERMNVLLKKIGQMMMLVL